MRPTQQDRIQTKILRKMGGLFISSYLRFLTHDDENQFQQSLKLFKTNDIFIPDTVILETEWMLRYAYNFDPITISGAFTKLFRLPNVQLSNPTIIAQV